MTSYFTGMSSFVPALCVLLDTLGIGGIMVGNACSLAHLTQETPCDVWPLIINLILSQLSYAFKEVSFFMLSIIF